MTQVVIKRWDGGVAQSERPETINEQADNSDFQGQNGSGGFDIFKDPFKLTKLTAPTVNETASGASVVSGECPVLDAVKRDTDGKIVGVGPTSASGSLLFRFYEKTTSITGAWTQSTSTTSSLGVLLQSTGGGAYCTLHKGFFYGFVSNVSSSNSRLYLYVDNTSQTLVGTISDYSLNYQTVKPIVHSQDKILYMAAGKTIATFTGATSTTTFTASAFTTPYEITALAEYGTYLAVLMQSPEGAIIGLWDRSNTTLFADIIKVDNGYGAILENLDGYLVTVTQTPYDPYSQVIPVVYSSAGTINVRMYIGGTMKLVKKARLGNNEQNSQQALSNRRMVRDGRLFFTTNSNFLWSFGQNRNGEYVLTKDIQVAYTNRTVLSMYSFFSLGEYLFACQKTTTGSPSGGLLNRTDSTFSTVDASNYTTTVNPSMPLADRIKQKTLKKIYIKVYSVSNSAALTVKYKFDGNATFTDAISVTGITTGYHIYEVSANADNTPFSDGRDLVLSIQATKQIDIAEMGYEYEVQSSLIN